tara:strand:+ start:616 stop:978 length:363 start_codon:yes stop_codon:yes gene_type:complete
MTRKDGDINFKTYVGYQAFSSDMPIHRINQSNWYLKFENNMPAFFIGADNVYRQMPPLAFFATADRTTVHDMTGWKKQLEDYFNLTIEEILCQTDIEPAKNLSSTQQSEETLGFSEKKRI